MGQDHNQDLTKDGRFPSVDLNLRCDSQMKCLVVLSRRKSPVWRDKRGIVHGSHFWSLPWRHLWIMGLTIASCANQSLRFELEDKSMGGKISCCHTTIVSVIWDIIPED